ncbi:MAG: hypothetical protein UV73_C0005G0064 [Candidatus Gottesmanbacteria bacterium GW2011_GWA2_43_14]|uniref:Uncharacterized protein n=1 Tax=Candidatus Gottesmanbacteria bacterium GW2011_GWA2_43_14 TaxID=1618443 RepID=A0A0G1DJN9_9BACT|nr:MAG: hypothetical protein UV73_C0005G0064 [Candidatus Gottesmanbacteria bacterium GW2011_GWA2_43_14]
MIEILLVIIIYLCASFIHIIKYRRQKAIKIGIINTYDIFLLFLPVLVITFQFIPVRWPLSSVFLYLLLSGVHFIFFTSPYLGDEGPSAKIYFLIKKQGEMNFKSLIANFSDEELIIKRIRNLENSKLILKKKTLFKTTAKGQLLSGLFNSYRQLLSWDTGG